MACGKGKRRGLVNQREIILQLFERNPEAGAKHRFAQCCHATECGRLCERLVKGPGKIAHCVDIKTNERTDLYPALEDKDFRCPEGRF